MHPADDVSAGIQASRLDVVQTWIPIISWACSTRGRNVHGDCLLHLPLFFCLKMVRECATLETASAFLPVNTLQFSSFLLPHRRAHYHAEILYNQGSHRELLSDLESIPLSLPAFRKFTFKHHPIWQ